MSDSSSQPQAAPAPTKKNPYTLWFVMLSFVAPVVAAYYMFFFGNITSFSNNGEFIKPVYALEELQLTRDGQPFNKDSLEHKWLIMLAVGAHCDDACQQQLINIRQIKRAVKRPGKIHYALLQTAEADSDFTAFIDRELVDAVLLQADAGKLADKLDVNSPVSAMLLSDPNGYMVMRFSHELTPKLVIKDLNRLF